MSITITKQPRAVVWSHNPVVFEMQTNNLYSVAGSAYVGRWTIADAVDGNTVTLRWNGVDHVFTFKNTPDQSGTQLPAKGALSVSEWLSQVSTALQSYYPLVDAYQLTNTATYITFTARERGSLYTITYTPAGISGSTFTQQTAGVNAVKRQNFAIYVEIQHLVSGVWTRFSQSTIEVGADGKAVWDVQEYVTSILLANGEVLPNLDAYAIQRDVRSVRSFRLVYAELYGNPQQVQKLTYSTAYTAVLGGVDWDKIATILLPDRYYDGVLHWVHTSDSKRIHYSQQDYLSIINLSAAAIPNAVAKARLYLTDNSERVVTIASWTAWSVQEKIIVPIRIASLVVGTNIAVRDVKKLDVWVEQSAGRLSSDFHYTVDQRYLPFVTSLLYLNSVGCFESLYIYGQCSYGYAIETNAKVFETSITRTQHDAVWRELDTELRDEVEVNTGYFSKKDIAKFREFFLSKRKLLLRDDRYHAVVLNTNSITEHTDGEHLHGLSFELQYSNEQLNWSV